MEKRPLIALLTNDLIGSYQYSVWSGMKAAARDEDCDLVSLNGGEIDSSDPARAVRNRTFDLIAHARPDAIVVMAPVVANSTSDERTRRFLDSLGPVPIVTVGFVVSGYPSILVDNGAAMKAVIGHAVETHGKRRFAYLGGPKANRESQERRLAFLEALEGYGIPFDPKLEIPGSFDFGIAHDHVNAILDAGARFDVLVSANDEMAFGAMEALTARGFRVPEDVLVTGFDAVEEGVFSTPSLTTVDQSLQEQGQTALRLVLDRLDGINLAPVTRLAPKLVLRESCGCHGHALRAAGLETFASSPGDFGGEEHLESLRQAIAGFEIDLVPEEAVRALFQSLVRGREAANPDSVLQTFRFLLQGNSRPSEDFQRWQSLVSVVRGASIPFLARDPVSLQWFESLCHQLRVVAHEHSVQRMAHAAALLNRKTRNLQEIGQHIVASFENPDLANLVEKDLRLIKISGMHIWLQEAEMSPGTSRLVLSIANGTSSGRPLPAMETGISNILEQVIRGSHMRSTTVIEPLHIGHTHLGFVALDIVSRLGMFLDALRSQIASTLVGVRLTEDLLHSPSELVA